MSSTSARPSKTVTPTKAYVMPKCEAKEGVAKDKVSMSSKKNIV